MKGLATGDVPTLKGRASRSHGSPSLRTTTLAGRCGTSGPFSVLRRGRDDGVVDVTKIDFATLRSG